MSGLKSGKLMVNQHGDVTVVYFLEQRILDEVNIRVITEDISYLIEAEARRALLINFQKVKYLSSAVLGKLVALTKQMKKIKGELKLCCIAPEIREVFTVTKLDKVIDIYDGEDKALKSFKKKKGFFGM